MSFSISFSEPYYTGGASSVNIVGKYHVALNGRPYMLDLLRQYPQQPFRHYSVQRLAQQQDGNASPSEASLNRNDLWRSSQDSWHKGAGQSVRDRADSDPFRFDTSKGVDPWTKWQLSLLPDTDQKYSSANTNQSLLVVGTYLYFTDGSNLRRTQDVTVDAPTWTDITGLDGTIIQSIASDGYTVYVAVTNGIYTTTRGASSISGAPFNPLPVSLLRYVNGRLMAVGAGADTYKLYNITGAGPTTELTSPVINTDFTWVDFTEGQTCIYAAGFSGDKSIIYRIPIKSDGTGLDVPLVAGVLPDGEVVRSIQSYLGFVLVGSDKGIRMAASDGDGNLTFGSLIPTNSAVRCFEPQDRFVWFGLTNFDGTATGLGRIDLSQSTAALTPAYASDIMADGQGNTTSVVTFQNRRVFTVSALGVYGEEDDPVETGFLESGQITYALADDKIAMFVDVRHDGIAQHSIALSDQGGAFSNLGVHTDSEDAFPCGERRGSRFELRITLTNIADVSPVIRSITLRAYPASPTVEMIDAPLLLAESLVNLADSKFTLDPSAEVSAITSLRDTSQLVSWQEGNTAYSVVVDDFEWHPTHMTENNSQFNGTMLVTMKRVTV